MRIVRTGQTYLLSLLRRNVSRRARFYPVDRPVTVGCRLRNRMEPSQSLRPLPVRLSATQIEWLDTLVTGPIVTRSEALRHVVADAMKRDARRRRALTRKVRGDA